MSDQADKPLSESTTRGVMWFIVLLVLYVLSIGPAWCLVYATSNGRPLLRLVYTPLLYFVKFVGANELLADYINWCADLLQIVI